MRKRILGAVLMLIFCISASGQFTYGTTGLLHMPTAVMQKDKTFMVGSGYLNKHATPDRWNYDTWNYYINITFLPWLEVAYTCTIFDEMKGQVHMINQDRFFSGRLRLWKEGWCKSWTPQIVVGGNDVLHGSAEGGDIGAVEGGSIRGNTFYQRYYVAATKHLSWHGEWGIHAAYVYSKRTGHAFNGPAFGINYQFALPQTSFINKAINGLNLMAEYDSKHTNIGASYTLWKDHINLIGEWYQCKYPSIGMYFKVHL